MNKYLEKIATWARSIKNIMNRSSQTHQAAANRILNAIGDFPKKEKIKRLKKAKEGFYKLQKSDEILSNHAKRLAQKILDEKKKKVDLDYLKNVKINTSIKN